MKFRRLLLERYGHFSARALDLPAAGLLLVHGPNEAGKSTTLAAIGDFLFGFPHKTRWDFQTEGKGLLVGAEVEDGHGHALTVWRRKGRDKTLLDADGQPLGEDALAPFLGGADRAFFENMYGLNHARLRAGGEDIAAARGALGEILFQAGAAVSGLHRVRGLLDGEADALFSDRARSKPLNQSLAALREAQKALRAAQLDAGKWASLITARDGVEAEGRALAEHAAATRRAAQDLARIGRVAPLLRRLEALEAERAALGAVPALPPDAGERRFAALTARTEAGITLAALAEEAAPLRASLHPPEADAALLAAAAAIEALAETRGAILKAADDLPRRREEAEAQTAAARRLLRDLGLPAGDGDPAALLPPRPALAALGGLARDMDLIAERFGAARRLLTEASATLAQAQAGLAAWPPVADPAAVRAAVDAARGLGRIADERATAARAVALTRTALDEAVSALGWVPADAAVLASLPLPAEAQVIAWGKTFAELDAEAAALRHRAAEASAEAAAQDAQAETIAAALGAGGALPTPAAVAQARAHRDQGWRLLRARYIDAAPADANEEAAFAAGQPLPAAYADAVRAADALADRRDAEAQRLAAHAAAVQAASRARARAAEAAMALDGLTERRGEAETAWQALWAPCGLRPAAPEAMREALRRHGRLLAGLESWRAAVAAEETLGQRQDSARRRLLAALGAPESAEGWDSLLDRAAAEAQRRETALQARAQAEKAVREAHHALHARTAAVAEAQEALTRWHADWAAALTAVPSLLPLAHRGVEAVRAVLDGLEQVRLRLAERDALTRRVADMERDRQAFAAQVRRLLADLAPDLLPLPDVDGARLLVQRLGEARARAAARAEAVRRLAGLDQRRDAAAAADRAARAALEALCRDAGVDTPEALPPVEQRAARASTLDAAIAAARLAVLEAADGQPLERMSTAVAATDLDALPDRLAALERDLTATTEAAQALGQRRQEAMAALAEAEALDAAAAAGRIEACKAEVENQSRRWLALKLSGVLLGQAIERYRAAHQGPLLRRGGDLFATLTGGSFAGLGVAYGADDSAELVGRRPDGATVHLDGLSEGSRDQLFLALRLAAVEMHAARGTPLPFVADDLLVNFDVVRAAAALRALADLSRRVQVLFFTHNAHMLDIAAAALPPEAFAVVDLG